jgi:cytoskeletal protein CcmA (bactofilin family)
LTIEKQARVDADIMAGNVVMSGELNGSIRATEKALLTNEGRMKGDICAARVLIAEGAQFKGSIRMDAQPEIKTD